MRFMMLVKANKDSEAGVLPDEKILSEMGKYNEELVKASALLAADGLQASSKGARVRYSNGKFKVMDGPFAETKELIAGFWLIQAKSKEEAIEWAKRVPFQEGEVEVRPLFELKNCVEHVVETVGLAGRSGTGADDFVNVSEPGADLVHIALCFWIVRVGADKDVVVLVIERVGGEVGHPANHVGLVPRGNHDGEWLLNRLVQREIVQPIVRPVHRRGAPGPAQPIDDIDDHVIEAADQDEHRQRHGDELQPVQIRCKNVNRPHGCP